MNPRIAVPLYSVIVFSCAMALAGVTFAPAQTWPVVLLSGFFLAGLGLAGGFVVAVHDASSGRWLGPVRRIACGLTRLVLPGSIVALLAITLGGGELYPAFDHDAHLSGFKAVWLERTFFTARAFACVVAWMIALAFLRRRRGAPAYLVIFGVTVSLATFDWVMALEPHWASTILPVYHFAGMVTGALAVIAIVAAKQSRTDASITSDHIHDVAKLLFAFSTFWMYIWFSQAMLIWYTNIPEEAAHYAVRAYGNWGVLFWTVVVVQWVLPFTVLLSETAKRNRTIVSRIAVAVLIGHWLDLYVSIVPAKHAEPALSGWELAIAFGAFAAVGWAVTRRDKEATTSVAPVVAPATAGV
jgi:hypothetical protein